ncbi:TAP-like protein [Pseudomonas sp. LP_7_YM]|nr:TAP-like protein [Pseudomonas sp. LP_7_YM]
MHHHISHVLSADTQNQLKAAKRINVPVLFMNGEWDAYTAASDARLFSRHIHDCHFTTIKSAGHFLDMEHRNACLDARNALRHFLSPAPEPDRTRHLLGQTYPAFAT